MKNLLLISNSTMVGEPYLEWTKPHIQKFLQGKTKKVLFIPYAGVALDKSSIENSYDLYEKRVKAVFNELGFELYSIHREADPVKAVIEAESIAVGGGNTFHLVHQLHEKGLMPVIKSRVENGMPYLGWSAGSNIACPSLRTTNDMPIIEPSSFNGLNVIPFQINPHYLDAHPEGHGGETREQRIEEFITVNKNSVVVGLREACLLKLEQNNLTLEGSHSLRVFKYGQSPMEYTKENNLNFLLK